jgi:hypothetical protein
MEGTGHMDGFAKPKHCLRAHGGPFAGKPIEAVVQSAEGRAWLAGFIPSRPEKHQRIGLAWLSWALQREVTLDDLDELAVAGDPNGRS